MKNHLTAIMILVGLLTCVARAQQDDELEAADGKVIQHIERKLSGWSHKRIQSVQGSKGVVVTHWQTNNRIVTLSLVKYDSAKSAQDVMQPFIKYQRQKEQIQGFGADAYAWGYGLSNIVFRRGKFLVYIETHADVDSDADAQNLTPQQRGSRERSEAKRLSRDFAKYAANALDQQ
jgi:hypothetical protein